MNIVHLAALKEVGGVERYLCDLVQHADAGASLKHLVVHRGKTHPFIARSLGTSTPTWSRKRWGPITLPRRPAWIRKQRLCSLLRSVSKGLCLLWNDPTDHAGLQVARDSGWRTAYWERGAGWHPYEDEDEVRAFLGGVDHLLANSRAGKRILELRWGATGLIEVLRNGVRQSSLPPSFKPRDYPTGTIRIGFAGRLEAIKGPNIALHVARELANAGLDFELHIAGTGTLSEPLEDLMSQLDIGSHVRFLGVVEDMPGFYAGLDLLIHPALREPCANVVPEAHAWGVPVIATRVDGMPELLPEESQQLLLEPEGDLQGYSELGASDGRMSPWVFDPDTDELRRPRFVTPDRWVKPILDLAGNPSAYEAASRRALHLIQESFLPEQALGLASHHLRKIGGAGHAD